MKYPCQSVLDANEKRCKGGGGVEVLGNLVVLRTCYESLAYICPFSNL